jgi:hypothetical protein
VLESVSSKKKSIKYETKKQSYRCFQKFTRPTKMLLAARPRASFVVLRRALTSTPCGSACPTPTACAPDKSLHSSDIAHKVGWKLTVTKAINSCLSQPQNRYFYFEAVSLFFFFFFFCFFFLFCFVLCALISVLRLCFFLFVFDPSSLFACHCSPIRMVGVIPLNTPRAGTAFSASERMLKRPNPRVPAQQTTRPHHNR